MAEKTETPQTATETAPTATITEEKKPEHHHHEHGPGCSHDHDHDDHEHKSGSSSDDDAEEGDGKGKTNRGQKKFHKAMTKLGMKPVTGINRVTVKKGKSFMFSIDDPEILKSPGADNTYVIFGKPNMDDINTRIGQEGFKNLSEPVQAPTTVTAEQPATEATQATEESGEELSETGLSAENIKMVMEYTKCSRATAIKTLRETNDDSVTAIMRLTQ